MPPPSLTGHIVLGSTDNDQHSCHLLNITYNAKHYIRYFIYTLFLSKLTLTFQGMYDYTHFMDESVKV